MPPTPPTPPSAPFDADKPQPSPEATAGAAKQYIRTFHGDVEVVKNGGTPNLVPLGDESRTTLEKVATPSPTEQPLLEPSPIETYAGDFTERMNTMQASTATVLAAEQDSAPTLVQVQPPKFSRSSILYSIAGGILIIASGVGAYIAYMRYIASSVPVVLTSGATVPIFVDDREPIAGTGTALLQAVQQSVASQLASGSVRLLYLETATSTNIFSALQLPAPGTLLRNINAVQSMAGVVNIGGAQSLFFILSVSSYGNTFAGMLQWEKSMPRDLVKLFPPYSVTAVAAPAATSTAATSTQTVAMAQPVTSVPTTVASFFDATVANHDVRVYRDSAGRDVVLYGYWNQTTLVIARDAAAFSEIIGRLATSRTL